jgi:uncharacterized membrane protein YedE/YeeE
VVIAPLFEDSRLAALVVGVGFGFALERAGLGSAPKLAGQFTLRDFTVFRVLFSAIVTAMLGAFWLSRLGMLDLARVYVPPTYIVPQLVGGAIFGVGFAVAGLCPGTACVSAATGRIDGVATVGGFLLGVLATGIALPRVWSLYERTPRGTLLLPDVLGVSYGLVVLAVAAIALAGFAATRWLDARRDARPGNADASLTVEGLA